MPHIELPPAVLKYAGSCIRCNRRTTVYDHRSQLYYQYCSKTCATWTYNTKHSKIDVYKHCTVRSRVWDSQRGRWHYYCGQACAQAAAADKSGRGPVYVQQVAQRPRRTEIAPPIRFFQATAPYFNLTNESRHPVAYNGCIYPTAQHAFQAMKFLPKYPDLAEHIRRCSSTDQARHETKRYKAYVRGDWFSTHRGKLVHIAKMEEILSLKFQQHPDLCEELASTADIELIYDNPSDAFWGVGSNNKGRNEFGRALMRLRKHVLEQA